MTEATRNDIYAQERGLEWQNGIKDYEISSRITRDLRFGVREKGKAAEEVV